MPTGHFLRQLERLVDWEAFADKLVYLYRGNAQVGRPPYNPAVILKMLLACLYDLSERRTEAFGSIQLVDSTHTLADVNVAKDDRRKKREGKPPRDGGARWGTRRKRRGGKKGSKGIWIGVMNQEAYGAGQREREKIERK